MELEFAILEFHDFFLTTSDEFKSKSSLGNSILGCSSSFSNSSSKNSPTN